AVMAHGVRTVGADLHLEQQPAINLFDRLHRNTGEGQVVGELTVGSLDVDEFAQPFRSYPHYFSPRRHGDTEKSTIWFMPALPSVYSVFKGVALVQQLNIYYASFRMICARTQKLMSRTTTSSSRIRSSMTKRSVSILWGIQPHTTLRASLHPTPCAANAGQLLVYLSDAE